ncbi:amidohydrolase [Herbidospora cretacea]|uniref:amidohydrolase n=1 Tax=Herbidospora cretacea TaxID=28444 RepID=UPI0007737830|nr:amidohydrolase [Herbidospora cretacea]
MTPVLPGPVRAALAAPLVDHHCQGVRRDSLVRAQFETLITRAGHPAPPGTTHFDTPEGIAIRRWCAPVLGLDPHAPAAVYLARRTELGAAEVNRTLLRAAGVVAFLVDTGTQPAPDLLSVAETGRLGGAASDEIVRLERVEQDVAEEGLSAPGYLDRLRSEVAARASRAVGLSTVIGYRCGLDVDPVRPSRGAVLAAAGRRVAEPKATLTDPVLLRHLLWTGVDVARERAMPLQIPCGTSGVEPGVLHKSDPTALAPFVRVLGPLGVPVILLHCSPYHREAAFLAAAFPHVHIDVRDGLADVLDLAPFHKIMFGSGGWGVAETVYLGALRHRTVLARELAARIESGDWSGGDAERVAGMIGSGNARRIYRL